MLGESVKTEMLQTSFSDAHGLLQYPLVQSADMLVILLVVAGTLAVSYVPMQWCGTDSLLCPAEVSGVSEDKCLHKDEPCGSWCHSYWSIAKVYCRETDKCHEELSPEHIDCRNKVCQL